MSNDTPSFKMGHEYDVIIPRKEVAYPIPGSDWDYLKKKVRRVSTGDMVFQTIGSALFGIAASAFVAALTIPAPTVETSSDLRGVAWAAFAISLLCGVLTLRYASKERGLLAVTQQDVLEEMERLEQKYRMD